MHEEADIVEHFAAHVADTTYEQLPAAAVDAAKKSILDTVGVILAASGTEPAVHAVIDLVREGGGRPEATVLGFGHRVPSLAAAFANGAMAHCLDFDDQTPWGQHSASSIVPAVLAVAERRGTVAGKELITAVAVGQDLFARMRRNVGWRKDWNLSSVLGVYAATAATSRVLDLPAAQAKHALGIASMQSSGVMEVVAGTGSNLRALYAGFSAKGAVLATLMAERGVTGVDRLFEGQYGVFATYFGGSYNRDAILAGLGQDFQGSTALYKMWPAVGTAHSHISATIELMVEHDIAPEDIAQLRVHVGDYHQLMCEPLDVRREPGTLVDAKFSLPFLVAVAAVRREVGIRDFSEDGLRSPEVLAMARKVMPQPDASLNWELDLPPGRVEVILHNGRRFVATGNNIPGSPQNPLTWQDLRRKFTDCASVSVAPPSAQLVSQALSMAETLEDTKDCAELVELLSRRHSGRRRRVSGP